MKCDANIVVFGSGGLIGSEIVKTLQKLSYSNITSCSHEDLELLNQAKVNLFFKEKQPQYIFFCAVKAITNFDSGHCIDAAEMYSNIMMQFNVMEAARMYNVKKAIFLGSAMLYPWNNEHQNELLCESLLEDFRINQFRDSMKSTVLSKFVTMKMCQYYYQQYGSNFIYAIPTHIYGGLKNRKHLYFLENLVIELCEAKLNNKNSIKLDIYGEGKARKQILHVQDCANAIITLMKYYENYLEPVNIGTNQYESWSSIVEKICEIINYKGEITFNVDKPERLENRLCSIEKLTHLGWSPKIDIDNGLRCLCNEYLQSKRAYHA